MIYFRRYIIFVIFKKIYLYTHVYTICIVVYKFNNRLCMLCIHNPVLQGCVYKFVQFGIHTIQTFICIQIAKCQLYTICIQILKFVIVSEKFSKFSTQVEKYNSANRQFVSKQFINVSGNFVNISKNFSHRFISHTYLMIDDYICYYLNLITKYFIIT